MKYLWFTLVLFIILTVALLVRKEQRIHQNNTVYSLIFEKIRVEESIYEVIIIPEFICVKCNSLIFYYIEEILKYNKSVQIIFFNKQEDIFEMISSEFQDTDIFIFFTDVEKEMISVNYPTILYIRNNSIRKIVSQNHKNPYALEKLVNK